MVIEILSVISLKLYQLFSQNKKFLVSAAFTVVETHTTKFCFGYADWQSFIDPEILKRDLGQDFGSRFTDGTFEGDIAGIQEDSSLSDVSRRIILPSFVGFQVLP